MFNPNFPTTRSSSEKLKSRFLTQKFAQSKKQHYFCSTLQFERGGTHRLSVSRLFLCLSDTIMTVLTPVWNVNASKASFECNVTGKQNRFIISAPLYSSFNSL